MELLKAVLQGLNVGATFLVVITVLVAVHEYGHYIVAKMCGMHVTAFAVMVGGIRKTDLADRLARPMAPSWIPWTVGAGVAAISFLGAFFGVLPVFYGGMAFLAVVGPIWVISRLCVLYHRPFTSGLMTLFKSWAVVAVVVLVGTRLQNVDAGYGLSMVLAASACAVLINYYFPVLTGSEGEANEGRGSILVQGERVPVRFRPVACKTNREGTEFSLLLLPLGGFAAMKGMQPQEDGSETKVDQGFFSKPPLARLAVLFAGPLFSVLFGMVLMFATTMAQGLPDKPSTTVGYLTTGPAKAAGIRVGDKIVAVNGRPVDSFFEVLSVVRKSYDKEFKPVAVTIDVMRDGAAQSFTFLPMVTPGAEPILDENLEPTGESQRQARLGFLPEPTYKPISVDKAATVAAVMPVVMVRNLFATFTDFKVAKENVGGPGAMVEQTAESVKQGWVKVIEMAAILSVTLGIMNLLPIPPLDGGQMAIAFFELIRGNRRLPMSLQNALHTVGAGLVVLLMLAVFAIDAGRRSELNRIKEETAVESR